MELVKTKAPRIIDFAGIPSENGNLWFAEVNQQLPFAIKRIYYIVDLPENAERGAHAHKDLDQLIIAMQGSFQVYTEDGTGTIKSSFTLDNPGKGLFLPGGLWRKLHKFAQGSICLVLASEGYDPSDYIRSYDEFLVWKSSQNKSSQ